MGRRPAEPKHANSDSRRAKKRFILPTWLGKPDSRKLVMRTFLFLLLFATANTVLAVDFGQLNEAIDKSKAVESVDKQKATEAVMTQDVKKGYESVDKQQAVESVDKQKVLEALTK
jgi:hypothetical protein